jgi:CPA2 family monovalent cation:H+ antiporter-2
MYHIESFIIILLIAALVIYLLGKFKISPVVGFLVSGIILGPYGLKLIKNKEEIELFAEIGVILLMFTLGLEFSLKNLFSLKRQIFVAGGLQVFITSLLIYLISLNFLRLEWNVALYLGFLISLSSTAIVLKLMMDRGEVNSVYGRNLVGILIFQDLIAIIFVLFIPILADKSGSITTIFLTILKSLTVIISVLLLSKWITPLIFNEVAKTRSRELFIISIILLSLSAAYFTYKLGLSIALGAFLAGILISESEYSIQAKADILPLKESFTGMFFISVGMLLNLSFFYKNILYVVLLTLGVIIVKIFTGALSTLLSKNSFRISLISGFYLAQIGEFSFVLILAGKAANIINGLFYQYFLSISIITMLLTPLVINATPVFSEYIINKFPGKSFKRFRISKQTKENSSVHNFENHTIIIGYGINGKNTAKVLKSYSLPYIIIDLNLKTVKKYKKEEQIYYGDAANADVLKEFGIEKAKVLVIAISDIYSTRLIITLARKLNNNLYIIVRTRYIKEIDELIGLGANEVIPEEFETSLIISAQVLNYYGIPKNVIMETIDELRKDCYKVLRNVNNPSQSLFPGNDVLKTLENITLLIKPNCYWVNKSIEKLEIRKKTGATVIAVNRNNEYIINPRPDIVFQEGDLVMLIGTKNSIHNAYNYFLGSLNDEISKTYEI